MKNPRITAKERGLIKGALRRAFSRSELRNRVADRTRIKHHDENRPRVTKWSWCQECGHIVPSYTTSLDHKKPVIPLNSSMEEMSADELINNIWCEEDNLQVLCDPCHSLKSKIEMQQRREFKKAKDIAEGKVKVKSGKSKSKKTTS